MLLARWLDAVRAPDRAREIATDDIRVHRFAPGKRGAFARQPEELITGIDAVIAWLRRSPPSLVWSLDGEAEDRGGRITCGYRYDIPGWHNTGVWVARAAGDRLAELWHYPHILVEDEVPPVVALTWLR